MARRHRWGSMTDVFRQRLSPSWSSPEGRLAPKAEVLRGTVGGSARSRRRPQDRGLGVELRRDRGRDGIVVTALAAVSEIPLPLLFAAVLAVIFKPLAGSLERRGFKPSLAAGLLVLGLIAVMVVVLVATVRGVLDQTDGSTRPSTRRSPTPSKSSASTRRRWTPRGRRRGRSPYDRRGRPPGDRCRSRLGRRLRRRRHLERLPIMYYLLKDGARLRRAVVAEVDDAYPRRGRRLHRRRVRDPARLRARPYGDVGDRCRRRRHRRPPARPPARVHDRGGELHRRLHPVHRRLHAGGAPSSSRSATAASVPPPSCSSSSWRRTCSWRTSSSPR